MSKTKKAGFSPQELIVSKFQLIKITCAINLPKIGNAGMHEHPLISVQEIFISKRTGLFRMAAP